MQIQTTIIGRFRTIVEYLTIVVNFFALSQHIVICAVCDAEASELLCIIVIDAVADNIIYRLWYIIYARNAIVVD